MENDILFVVQNLINNNLKKNDEINQQNAFVFMTKFYSVQNMP